MERALGAGGFVDKVQYKVPGSLTPQFPRPQRRLMQDSLPPTDHARSRDRPLQKPAASPIPVIRRNVLRTGTTDHQLADFGGATLNDLVMTTSRASRYRREKALIHQGPY